MKKTILLLSTAFFFCILNAQIDLENSYDGYVRNANLESKGPIYYSVDSYNNKCIFYNFDHSIWKTIDIEVPENNDIYNLQYVSQHLFNEDDLIEMTMEYYEYQFDQDSILFSVFTTEVINEEGTVLLSVEGGAYPYVYKVGDDNAKLSIYIYDYSQFLYPIATNIYDIPGVPASVNDQYGNEYSPLYNDPYPNPSSGEITIPYSLPNNIEVAELILSDVSGKIVKKFRIDDSFNNLKINVKSYSQGTYFYWIDASGYKSESKKFIVN